MNVPDDITFGRRVEVVYCDRARTNVTLVFAGGKVKVACQHLSDGGLFERGWRGACKKTPGWSYKRCYFIK
ncbi:hypothetical protein JXD38_05000 [candidate division WOR-3 bacterium]|nr:hypothetical protein [candidate division WOR-3 bacterium]